MNLNHFSRNSCKTTQIMMLLFLSRITH